jgi:hypothetical protein
MRAIGIHYSNSHFHYVVLNANGEIALRGKIRANRDELRREFCAIEPTCIAMQWTASTRWAAELLSSMHHSVLYSVVAEKSAPKAAMAPRAVETIGASDGAMAHELYAPMFAGNLDWVELDRALPRAAADCKAEQHAQRLRRQWTRGVAMMRPASAMETALYV